MSLLQNTMAKSGTSGFYNGVATTSFRNDPGVVLTDECDAPTSAKIMSFGGWVKRNKIGHYSNLFSGSLGGSGVPQSTVYFDTDNALKSISYTGSAYVYDYRTTQLFRDTSAWYHIWVQIDTTDGTQTDRFKLYANGVRITSFSNAGLIADGSPDIRGFNEDGITAYFGHTNTSYGGNVYYSDWYFIDGSAVSPVDTVGEFKNGVFIPKSYSPTFGNNGFNLKFDQVGVGSPSSSTIGADSSGSSRHFISTAGTDAVASDCAMPDSPENNFATWNEVDAKGSEATMSEGNLKVNSADNSYDNIPATFMMSSGKWYWEVTGNNYSAAICGVDGIGWGGSVSGTGSNAIGYWVTGPLYYDGGNITGGASYATSDVLAVSVDMDSGVVKFYKNNSEEYSVTFGESGIPDLSSGVFPIRNGYGTSAYTIANFGQDSSFAGNETAQGNTDGNGIGDFYYEPPSGFLALCTSNLPEPTIGANSDTQADDYFNTVLYTGNGSTQSITGVGFQPDWLWIKSRNHTHYNGIFDSNRGSTKRLFTNDTSAESTQSAGVTSFDSDGFSLGSNAGQNENTKTFVAWNWLANGGTTTTNDASSTGIGTIDSVFQANTTAGFSIVTYTGNSTAGATVRHGLTVAPEMVIVKSRTSAHNWVVYHKGQGVDKYIELNNTTASQAQSSYNMFNSTAPTSSVFTIGTLVNTNTDKNYIAYCFHPVEGYSKFGSYTGNGNADGTFVALNFRPAWIIFKRTDSANSWLILDNQRDTDNPVHKFLHADNSEAEDTSNDQDVDFLSNGFKTRNANARNNASGGSYIYMAFAEAPFKYANAR